MPGNLLSRHVHASSMFPVDVEAKRMLSRHDSAILKANFVPNCVALKFIKLLVSFRQKRIGMLLPENTRIVLF